MMMNEIIHKLILLTFSGLILNGFSKADEFNSFLKPLFTQKCTACHGQPREGKKAKVKGKVNLYTVKSEKDLLAQPKMIKEMIEAIDANDMPPEDEPQLDEASKKRLITSLKHMLAKSTQNHKQEHVQIHRLNRFQYNNAVKDLFKLNRDIFNMPEKMMTRRMSKNDYLNNLKSGKMPDKVHVFSQSYNKDDVFKEVKPFPQDLRAAHGFDNQADNLSLPTLLHEALLKLSISIVNSPDFTPATVGIWNEFFAEPKDKSKLAFDIKMRLRKFLTNAFRHPVDETILNGYTKYTMDKISAGMPFTDAMKKTASASLSSPLFIYKYKAMAAKDKEYALASKLSFMLWGSSPDEQLLKLAEKGELSKTLPQTIDRMMHDPKIERFLDTFPSQWMQLNVILDSMPNKKEYGNYSIDKHLPAGAQLLLEPLLLFDAVYIENRPVIELIKPSFGYRSDYLNHWYGQNSPPTKEELAFDKQNNQKHIMLNKRIGELRAYIKKVEDPARRKTHETKRAKLGKVHFVNAEPYARWSFNGNTNDSFDRVNLSAVGKVSYKDGHIVLNNAYLKGDIPEHIRDRTFVFRFKLNSLKQKGGLIGIQDSKDTKKTLFDSFVFATQAESQWAIHSHDPNRVKALNSPPETKNEFMTMVISHAGKHVKTFRDGQLLSKQIKVNHTENYHKGRGTLFIGTSDLTDNGQRLNITIESVEFHRRGFNDRDLKALSMGANNYVSMDEIIAQSSPEDKVKYPKALVERRDVEKQLRSLPPKNHRQLKLQNQLRRSIRQKEFFRVSQTDPRYGGIITNSAMLTMTSTSIRTRPITRGAWIIEVILNDPPPPPPNNVPPLKEDKANRNLTIREVFAEHRENPDCAGCHDKIDPLGFSMENFNPIGLWREKYKKGGRQVDPHGTLFRKYPFKDIVDFKDALVKEEKRFAKAFTAHLLRFAVARELAPGDALIVEKIVNNVEKDRFKVQSLIKEVILSKSFIEN